MARKSRYSSEFRSRAVDLVRGSCEHHDSEWEAMRSVASKLGVSAETVRKWVRQAETDAGARPGLRSEEQAELRKLRQEVRELRRANEVLRAASIFFAGELDPRPRSL